MKATLRVFPNPRACQAAIDRLHAEYKRIHQRALTVDLLLSVGSKKVGSKSVDEYGVALYADDAETAQIQWLTNTIQTL